MNLWTLNAISGENKCKIVVKNKKKRKFCKMNDKDPEIPLEILNEKFDQMIEFVKEKNFGEVGYQCLAGLNEIKF